MSRMVAEGRSVKKVSLDTNHKVASCYGPRVPKVLSPRKVLSCQCETTNLGPATKRSVQGQIGEALTYCSEV